MPICGLSCRPACARTPVEYSETVTPVPSLHPHSGPRRRCQGEGADKILPNQNERGVLKSPAPGPPSRGQEGTGTPRSLPGGGR
jgi:hypothetical protein